MRQLMTLILVGAFLAAVILPTDVGTHDLPATGAKQLTKAGGQSVKPGRSGPVMALVLLQADTWQCSGCVPELVLRFLAPSFAQHSLPLLI